MIFWKKSDKAEPISPPTDKAPIDNASGTSWLGRLSSGLSSSSQKLTQGLTDSLTKRPLDQEALDDMEEQLIAADLGPVLAAKLTEQFGKTRFGKQVTETEIKQALAQQIEAILQPVAKPFVIDRSKKPFVVLMVGVNGSGKTTTIGKLAQQYKEQGLSVVLAAGDTFRAAAVEQLQQWGQRTGATVIAKGLNTDAAAVAFEAVEAAQKANADVLLIDTAGRLHNKANLMEELSKICRVIQKQIPDAPHAVLLTLDATTGQNALTQVEQFHQIVPLTGLIVTKLDGSAKGGIVIALADKMKLPIFAVGVGETAADLQAFESSAFAGSLLGLGR